MNIKVYTKIATRRRTIRTRMRTILIPSWLSLEVGVHRLYVHLGFKPFRRTNEFDKLLSFKIWKGSPVEHH